MFSAFTAAQNKVSSIPITAVTFSIGSNTNSTYTGSAQSVTVVSTMPPGATFSTSTTTATNAGDVASTTITGTGIYTGTFTSPNLTISKVNLVFSNFDGFNCGGFDVLQSTITVSGFVGGQSGLLTIYTGTGVTPTAVAGVSGSDGAGANVNKVSQLTGANPIALGNVSGYTGMYLTKSDFGLVYFAQISGGGAGSNAANYNSTYAPNPLQNDCGS
jgi:hypothetical protein